MDGIDDCTNRAASPAVRTVAARRDRSVHLTEYDLVLKSIKMIDKDIFSSRAAGQEGR